MTSLRTLSKHHCACTNELWLFDAVGCLNCRKPIAYPVTRLTPASYNNKTSAGTVRARRRAGAAIKRKQGKGKYNLRGIATL